MIKNLYIITLFLFFIPISLNSSEISDLEIEGISIGESALKITNRHKIIEEGKKNAYQYQYLKEPNKFGEIYILENDDFEIYDGISFYVNMSDPNFKIFMLRGLIWLDINSCLSKRNEIKKDIENILGEFEKFETVTFAKQDELNESKYHHLNYTLASGGFVNLLCTDWSKNMKEKFNYSSGLSVAIFTEEVNAWLNNY